nr:nuclear pore complex-interacting protein family member B3-like [Penaeus vannamei]
MVPLQPQPTGFGPSPPPAHRLKPRPPSPPDRLKATPPSSRADRLKATPLSAPAHAPLSRFRPAAPDRLKATGPAPAPAPDRLKATPPSSPDRLKAHALQPLTGLKATPPPAPDRLKHAPQPDRLKHAPSSPDAPDRLKATPAPDRFPSTGLGTPPAPELKPRPLQPLTGLRPRPLQPLTAPDRLKARLSSALTGLRPTPPPALTGLGTPPPGRPSPEGRIQHEDLLPEGPLRSSLAMENLLSSKDNDDYKRFTVWVLELTPLFPTSSPDIKHQTHLEGTCQHLPHHLHPHQNLNRHPYIHRSHPSSLQYVKRSTAMRDLESGTTGSYEMWVAHRRLFTADRCLGESETS